MKKDLTLGLMNLFVLSFKDEFKRKGKTLDGKNLIKEEYSANNKDYIGTISEESNSKFRNIYKSHEIIKVSPEDLLKK